MSQWLRDPSLQCYPSLSCNSQNTSHTVNVTLTVSPLQNATFFFFNSEGIPLWASGNLNFVLIDLDLSSLH